jgi:hypothetical protein
MTTSGAQEVALNSVEETTVLETTTEMEASADADE